MTEFVQFLFSPGGLVISVLLATLWVAARPQSRLARRFLGFIVASYTLMSIYAVTFVLTRPLVLGYHPLTAADVPPGRTAVVVLGSGSYSIQDWSGNEYSTTDESAASRVLEAVRVYRLINPEWVIASGGKLHPDDVAQATGDAMRSLLVQLGVPPGRIVLQTTSRNTHEEAQLNLDILRGVKADHVVVVTSDVHMRRAVGTFRAEGVEVIPAIARDPFQARSWQDWVAPSDTGLWGASSLAHETLGIGYYAARGWYRF